jgi:hypothetical protein
LHVSVGPTDFAALETGLLPSDRLRQPLAQTDFGTPVSVARQPAAIRNQCPHFRVRWTQTLATLLSWLVSFSQFRHHRDNIGNRGRGSRTCVIGSSELDRWYRRDRKESGPVSSTKVKSRSVVVSPSFNI